MADTIFVCETCCLENMQTPGADFAARLAERFDPESVEIRTVACLNQCDEPMSLALRSQGKTAYLFAKVQPEDLDDAAALIRLYTAALDGEIKDARPAGRLRHCLVGRIPAI